MDVSSTISLTLLKLLSEAELRCVMEDFNRERISVEHGELSPR